MPASTANLKPVIVYLPPEVYAALEQKALKADRSLSYMARAYITGALAKAGQN